MPQSLRSLSWLASLSLGGSRLVTGGMPQSLRSLRSLRLVRHLAGGARGLGAASRRRRSLSWLAERSLAA
jgi:hypothetical protein